MIEELQRFVLVAHTGNITKAAEKIFITQSTLSQSIKRLEKSLGSKLFIQKGRHLQLNQDGIAVFALANKMLTLWENAKNPQIRKSLKASYSLGMFDNAALRLSKYLQKIINDNTFELELIIDNSGRLFSQLKLGILDAGICVVDNNNPLPNGIFLVKNFMEELIPVSSIKYNKSIDEIPFILYNKGSNTRKQTDKLFINKGIVPKIFAESTSPTFMKELAIVGGGVALLPSNFVKSEIKRGILKKQKLPLRFQREFGIYIESNSRLNKDHPLISGIIKILAKK